MLRRGSSPSMGGSSADRRFHAAQRDLRRARPVPGVLPQQRRDAESVPGTVGRDVSPPSFRSGRAWLLSPSRGSPLGASESVPGRKKHASRPSIRRDVTTPSGARVRWSRRNRPVASAASDGTVVGLPSAGEALPTEVPSAVPVAPSPGDDLPAPVLRGVADGGAALLPYGHHGARRQGGSGDACCVAPMVPGGSVDRSLPSRRRPSWLTVGDPSARVGCRLASDVARAQVATANTYAQMFSNLPSCGKPTRLLIYDLHTLQVESTGVRSGSFPARASPDERPVQGVTLVA